MALQPASAYHDRFDPTLGAKIGKTRPDLVVQNYIRNQYSHITIVAAIASKFSEPRYSTGVVMEPEESGLSPRSAVVLIQIRSADRWPLGKLLGHAGPTTMDRVDKAIQISLGLIKI